MNIESNRYEIKNAQNLIRNNGLCLRLCTAPLWDDT